MAFQARRAFLFGSASFLALLGAEAAAQDRPTKRERAIRRARIAAAERRRRERFQEWRKRLVERRRRARALAADSAGAFFARGIVLAAAPTPESLAIAQGLGFAIGRRRRLEALDMDIVVLRAPEGMHAQTALERLRAADPTGSYGLNHMYDPSGAQDGAPAAGPPLKGPPAPGVRIGMIDSGLDARHPAFADVKLKTRSFVEAPGPGAPHGIAVGSLLAAALPQCELFAADVFGEDDLAGSTEALAAAMAWMAQEGVGVINISLTGPLNPVVGAVMRRLAQRGCLIVAACGNDGPTAPVAFPAADPSAIAVTAVDEKRRVYLAANRGPQIMFAAPGVDISAADEDGGWTRVSGTSFAAPAIAAIAARRLPKPDPAGREALLRRLQAEAADLGAPGRDPIYGFGLIAGLAQPS